MNFLLQTTHTFFRKIDRSTALFLRVDRWPMVEEADAGMISDGVCKSHAIVLRRTRMRSGAALFDERLHTDWLMYDPRLAASPVLPVLDAEKTFSLPKNSLMISRRLEAFRNSGQRWSLKL